MRFAGGFKGNVTQHCLTNRPSYIIIIMMYSALILNFTYLYRISKQLPIRLVHYLFKNAMFKLLQSIDLLPGYIYNN